MKKNNTIHFTEEDKKKIENILKDSSYVIQNTSDDYEFIDCDVIRVIDGNDGKSVPKILKNDIKFAYVIPKEE
jgi:predicted protein tyrosine phosphatase